MEKRKRRIVIYGEISCSGSLLELVPRLRLIIPNAKIGQIRSENLVVVYVAERILNDGELLELFNIEVQHVLKNFSGRRR